MYNRLPKTEGLSADGIVGANTWGKMENDLDPLQVSYNVYFRCNTKNVMYMEQTTAKTQFYSYTDKGAKRTTPFLTTYG